MGRGPQRFSILVHALGAYLDLARLLRADGRSRARALGFSRFTPSSNLLTSEGPLKSLPLIVRAAVCAACLGGAYRLARRLEKA